MVEERALSDVTRTALNVSAERPRPRPAEQRTNRPFKPPGPAMLWCANDTAEDDDQNGFDIWGDLCENDSAVGVHETADDDWEQLDCDPGRNSEPQGRTGSPSYSPPSLSPNGEREATENRQSEHSRAVHNPFARHRIPPDAETALVLGPSQPRPDSVPIDTAAMLEQVLRPGKGATSKIGSAAPTRAVKNRVSRAVPLFQPPRLQPVQKIEQHSSKPAASNCHSLPHNDQGASGMPLPGDPSSTVIDLSGIDERPSPPSHKPTCSIFDLPIAQPSQRIKESRGVGHAHIEMGDDAWWWRLPDFVPVAVLHAHGCNPRDGSTVYIQYADQFSGSKALKSRNTPKPKVSTNNLEMSNGHSECEPTNAQYRPSLQPHCGHWITINGRKVYVNAAGKHLSGRQAYSVARKEKEGKFAKGSNSKRGRRK